MFKIIPNYYLFIILQPVITNWLPFYFILMLFLLGYLIFLVYSILGPFPVQDLFFFNFSRPLCSHSWLREWLLEFDCLLPRGNRCKLCSLVVLRENFILFSLKPEQWNIKLVFKIQQNKITCVSSKIQR